MNLLLASIRVIVATMFICCVAYTLAIFGFAQLVTPHTANGHLVRDASGNIAGSLQVAQAFTSPRYFWPRPSAVDYDGAGAGGSNLSPTNPKLTERAAELVTAYSATATAPLPPDLAAASGSGLDPHISEAAARYQAARIAEVRDIPAEDIGKTIDNLAFRPGGILTPDRVVNVLQLNLDLDKIP